MSVNINDSKHFAENVRRKLSNWGYGYRYIPRQGVQILSKPETPTARLSELLHRGLGADVQIDPVAFACFIVAFDAIDGFNSMPWGERVSVMKIHYGVSVCDRTLQNWFGILKENNIIQSVSGSTAWCTYSHDGEKYREPLGEESKDELQHYYQRRKELFDAEYVNQRKSGVPVQEANKKAWDITYKNLWSEFGCCYYYCKTFALSAFSCNGVDVREIYELVDEIMQSVPPINSVA